MKDEEVTREMKPVSIRRIAAHVLTTFLLVSALGVAACYSTGGFITDRSGADGGTDAVTSGSSDAGASSDRDTGAADAANAGDTPAPPDASSDQAQPGSPPASRDGAVAPDAGSSMDATSSIDLGGQTGTGGQSGAGSPSGAGGGSGSPASGMGGAGGLPGGMPASTVAPYTLVFSDEFEGASLDRTKWCTRYVYGGGAALQVPDGACTGPKGTDGTLDFLNDEQERYVDYNTKNEAMHVVGGGTLSLRATKTRADTGAPYEAAMLRSKFEFKPSDGTSYFVVARLRLPSVIGTWPALWLNGGFGTTGQTQWPPEIDIFEGALNGVEDTVNMIRMGSQVRGLQTDSQKQEITSSQSFDTNWDNYKSGSSLRGVWLTIGAVWTAKSVCYFANGTNAMCENYRWSDNAGAAGNPASLLLNLAIGGAWAGRHGIDDTMFPTSFDVDFVHVYQFSGQTAPTPLPN